MTCEGILYQYYGITMCLIAATISLFLATFPIKSTGSIFTTSNATYVALLASIILSYKKLQKKEILG